MSTINKSLLSLSRNSNLHSKKERNYIRTPRQRLQQIIAQQQIQMAPFAIKESCDQPAKKRAADKIPIKNAISKNNPFYLFPCAPLAVNMDEKETKTCRPKNEIHIKQIWIFLWPRNFWLMIRATITEKPGKKLLFQAENKNEMLRYW